MIKTMIGVAAIATLLAACGQKTAEADNTNGPVVAASESPRNEAVDTTPTQDAAALTPGANSFTEAQAKGAIEASGYTGVSALTQDANGVWSGTATKDGAEAKVAVDYKGVVSAS
ncbi:hypothetical protein ASE17_20510 [Phenylobacterium sp. Root77]|jgi:hypothetical protein|uniref:hypothetical protein n=1 Tax=unclassified Phenylobacterium TaxID=2640670 RepID=UPI0006FB5A4C|nr:MULTISPECIES: hypothetical protein [unclassified Phenylobacterium]KQW67039.1 hypothetical protein ASC73_18095 [Phenylobacterium sp. Root1277]KQW89732.1 hypothetical protein ASC79_19000 [Phenylobacterium sp. Root1290]KRC43579.1 hypothetical protein ASE17_20510 [Phenylobacterium sp. Root77]